MTKISRQNESGEQGPFESELRTAISARRSVADLTVRPSALSPNDRREWRRQARLDEAIKAWKQSRTAIAERGGGRLLGGRAMFVSAALLLALCGLPSHVGSLVTPGPAFQPDVRATRPASPMVASVSTAENRTNTSGVAARRARLSRRASRLVYAFKPVRQRVDVVMEHLIDAVPGADLLAAWSHDS